MMRISSFPALTKFSLVLCVLGLAMTLVLLQEQLRRVGMNATISVSLAIPFHSVIAVDFDV